MNPEHKPLFDKLTRLQKGICIGLLEGKTQASAYFDAGGLAKNDENANSIVSRMISTDVNVMAFMSAAEGEAVSNAVMTRMEALERLSMIASTSASDLVEFSTIEIIDSEGFKQKQTIWSLKDGVEQTPEAMAAIAELNASRDGFKFKLHSSTAAIEKLAAMLGWNAPTKVAKTDSKGNDKDDMSERELARRVAFMLAQGVKDSDA